MRIRSTAAGHPQNYWHVNVGFTSIYRGHVLGGRVDFFTKSRAFTIEKAKRLLGYRPVVDLETGISLDGGVVP